LCRAILTKPHTGETDSMLLENLLLATDNIITYRRRYRSYLNLHTVLEQLLNDHSAPRSLIYQLEKLQTNLKLLPREQVGFNLSPEEKLLLSAQTKLRLIDLSAAIEVDEESELRQGLDDLFSELSSLLSEMSMTISKYYFTHAEVPHPLITLPPELDDVI
ncbi:MAG: alpha-E domain-containing protein, partial [Chloroflexota bacterium]